MLGQRVATAVVLLMVLLPALFYHAPEPFCVLAMVFIAAGAWEWARLAAFGPSAAWGAGGFSAIACAAAWSFGMLELQLTWLWAAAAMLWILGGAWLLRGGPGAWHAMPRVLRLGVGLVVLWLAWLAVAQARIAGINFLLSVMVLVWAADVAAYFTGRRWGGRWIHRKLAPSISPGKSWEGVFGGMVGVLVLFLVWRWADAHWQADAPSLYTQLARSLQWLAWPAILGLTAMSVVGDLLESLVKRSAGVKDSSGLLPGHGGVLDRLDALLPTLPLALLLNAL